MLGSVTSYSSYLNRKRFNTESEVLTESSEDLKKQHVTRDTAHLASCGGCCPALRVGKTAAGTVEAKDTARVQAATSLSRKSAAASRVRVPKTTLRLCDCRKAPDPACGRTHSYGLFQCKGYQAQLSGVDVLRRPGSSFQSLLPAKSHRMLLIHQLQAVTTRVKCDSTREAHQRLSAQGVYRGLMA